MDVQYTTAAQSAEWTVTRHAAATTARKGGVPLGAVPAPVEGAGAFERFELPIPLVASFGDAPRFGTAPISAPLPIRPALGNGPRPPPSPLLSIFFAFTK